MRNALLSAQRARLETDGLDMAAKPPTSKAFERSTLTRKSIDSER